MEGGECYFFFYRTIYFLFKFYSHQNRVKLWTLNEENCLREDESPGKHGVLPVEHDSRNRTTRPIARFPILAPGKPMDLESLPTCDRDLGNVRQRDGHHDHEPDAIWLVGD